MGGGGGGTTTNVTNTGLGDDQYQFLSDNQVGISDQITGARTDADAAYQNIYGRVDTLNSGVTGLANNIGSQGQSFDFSGFAENPFTLDDTLKMLKHSNGLRPFDEADTAKYDFNKDGVVDLADINAGTANIVGLDPNTVDTGLYKQFSDQNQNLVDQFGNVMAGQGDLNKTIGQQAIGTQNAIGGQLDALGNTVGGRFDTVDTNVGNVQGAVDQGFIDQAQGFTDAQADRTAQFDAATNARDAGFAANAQGFVDMGQGFTDASDQLTATQKNVLDGQGALQTDLGAMADAADVYAGQSLENQGALQKTADGFQTSFDTYTERYGGDQEIAQQSRADLAAAQANQTDRLRKDMGDYAQAAATGQQKLSTELGDAAAGIGSVVEGGFMDTNDAIAQSGRSTTDDINRSITASADNTDALMENLDAGQVTAARDMARIASAQSELDVGMRQEFGQLGQSFDDSGKLIKNSIDAQGNTITRSMDAQGNLMLRSFDVTGQNIGEQVINVQNSLQQLNDLQNKRGANVAMGNLSPPMSASVPETGFASPYTTTG
jgi:hypothetical protein